MISFDQFECTDHVTSLRYITTSNNSRQYRLQCIKCGRSVGKTSIKYADLSDEERAHAIPFDEVLLHEQSEERNRMYRAALDAEQTQKSIEWFKEHNEYLNSPEWRFKKRLVMNRDHFTCQANLVGCTHEADEVHHLTYDHWKNEPLFDLIAVCHHCHNAITAMDRASRSR